MTVWCKEIPGGLQFKVRVQPRAAKNELAGVLDDALKVRLTSPPVEGEANAHCVRFFAELFKVPKGSVRIVAGETSRTKTVEVVGLDRETFRAKVGH